MKSKDMSQLQFDRDANQFRVLLPAVIKLPPNPHFGQGALQHSSAADTEDERLIACDQRSFITGSASADLQTSHIIKFTNTNRLRKQELEDYLSQQRLQDPSRLRFLLDSPTNAILLEASLHVQWDLYGTFCIVPSETDAAAMLDALNNINHNWTKYDPHDGITRPLDITQPPFAQPHWDIVILHPHAFLPESQPLAIALNRTYCHGQSSEPVPSLTWTSWIAEGDQLCSALPSRAPLPSFVVDNLRSALNRPVLSSLAMVINAHSKLNLFIRNYSSSVTPRVQRLAQLMSNLVTAICFVPQGYRGLLEQPDAPPFPIEDRPEAHDKSNTQDVVGSPKSPDEDGLTDLEFQIVAARANDSFLDPKQRANAAMVMLYGACQNVSEPENVL